MNDKRSVDDRIPGKNSVFAELTPRRDDCLRPDPGPAAGGKLNPGRLRKPLLAQARQPVFFKAANGFAAPVADISGHDVEIVVKPLKRGSAELRVA